MPFPGIPRHDFTDMRYISTRGQTEPHSFSRAVAVGLAPDGGLFLPEKLPDLSPAMAEWSALPYPDLCYAFFRCFATDIDGDRLRGIVDRSYRCFDHPEVAPLARLDEDLFVLELFHGPTLAFKDFALQLLGNLYAEQIATSGRGINVLGATSGDTGAAAIHGLLGKEGVSVFILYPDGRVSPLQERQMVCTGADNVFPLAIQGSFDDAQAALKEVFAETAFKEEFRVSAVNSINLARVLAQCVYYLYAWFRLPAEKRARCEFVVPTGNFGNVLAGWLLRGMGVPVPAFRIATNRNDILCRLFNTGEYRVGAVSPSLAPSMDIQVASNFERFLYYAVDGDGAEVRRIMAILKEKGEYRFEHFERDVFSASRMTDGEIPAAIESVYRRFDYVVDPHTACAFKELDPGRTSVVLATASPAKFPDTIRDAIGIEPKHETLEALKARPLVKYPIRGTRDEIMRFIRDHAAAGEAGDDAI